MSTRLIYLSGCVDAQLSEVPGTGYIITPRMGNRVPDEGVWAADNGCFRQPEAFDLGRYTAWLKAQPLERCLFATLPDRVGDWPRTLAQAAETIEAVRETGGPVALVAQDGAEGGLPVHLGLDAVFIGGSDPWRASEAPYRVVAAARAHGLWVHWGRANSLRAVRRLRAAGVHSADGTYLAHGPDANRPRLEGWMRDGAACAPLAFAAPMPPRSVLRCAGCGVGVMWRHHQAIRWAAHDLALGLADEVAIEAYGEEAGGPGPACWACHQAGERAALRAAELRRADWAA